jgi:hypothetical protein
MQKHAQPRPDIEDGRRTLGKDGGGKVTRGKRRETLHAADVIGAARLQSNNTFESTPNTIITCRADDVPRI